MFRSIEWFNSNLQENSYGLGRLQKIFIALPQILSPTRKLGAFIQPSISGCAAHDRAHLV